MVKSDRLPLGFAAIRHTSPLRSANEESQKSVSPPPLLRRDPLLIFSVWMPMSSNPKNTKRSLKSRRKISLNAVNQNALASQIQTSIGPNQPKAFLTPSGLSASGHPDGHCRNGSPARRPERGFQVWHHRSPRQRNGIAAASCHRASAPPESKADPVTSNSLSTYGGKAAGRWHR